MKRTDSARCPSCTDSLGRPQEVVEEDDEEFTLYVCSKCDNKWYRTHV